MAALATGLVLLGTGLTGGWALATYWPDRTAAIGGATAARGPVVLAVPFADDGSPAASATLVRGFSREVVAGLARFGGLAVFDAELAGRAMDEVDEQCLAELLAADFIPTGGVSVTADRFAVTAP